MFAQAAIQVCSQKNSAEKGMYPGQAFLFISRLPGSSRVSSILYSSSLCIFHIDSPFMFYVRQLRREQLCGRRILSYFRRRVRENSFQWEKWSRMPNADSVPANKQELQTKALLQLLHYHNTRRQHLALRTPVIWKQIDRIYKFSAYLRRDPPWPQSSLSTSAQKSCRRLFSQEAQTLPG